MPLPTSELPEDGEKGAAEPAASKEAGVMSGRNHAESSVDVASGPCLQQNFLLPGRGNMDTGAVIREHTTLPSTKAIPVTSFDVHCRSASGKCKMLARR